MQIKSWQWATDGDEPGAKKWQNHKVGEKITVRLDDILVKSKRGGSSLSAWFGILISQYDVAAVQIHAGCGMCIQ